MGLRKDEVKNGRGEIWKDRNLRMMEKEEMEDMVERIEEQGDGKK